MDRPGAYRACKEHELPLDDSLKCSKGCRVDSWLVRCSNPEYDATVDGGDDAPVTWARPETYDSGLSLEGRRPWFGQQRRDDLLPDIVVSPYEISNVPKFRSGIGNTTNARHRTPIPYAEESC